MEAFVSPQHRPAGTMYKNMKFALQLLQLQAVETRLSKSTFACPWSKKCYILQFLLSHCVQSIVWQNCCFVFVLGLCAPRMELGCSNFQFSKDERRPQNHRVQTLTFWRWSRLLQQKDSTQVLKVVSHFQNQRNPQNERIMQEMSGKWCWTGLHVVERFWPGIQRKACIEFELELNEFICSRTFLRKVLVSET